jgi:hypothetical protein
MQAKQPLRVIPKREAALSLRKARPRDEDLLRDAGLPVEVSGLAQGFRVLGPQQDEMDEEPVEVEEQDARRGVHDGPFLP